MDPTFQDRERKEQRMEATNMNREPRRPSRIVLLGMTGIALLAIAIVLVAVAQTRDDAPATAQAPAVPQAPENTVNAGAERVATRFLQAYGAFDLNEMRTSLADDATIASMGAEDDPRLLISWLEATGYKQTLDSCEQLGNSASGSIRCPFDFHALRSGEIGRGPFSGSSFELVVSDGKVVHASQDWEIGEFGPRVWEPFAGWVSNAHPKDAAVMYTDGCCHVRLTEESIRLWERNTQRYVDEVKRNRRSVSRASSVRSG
jgi:hypothetical protein